MSVVLDKREDALSDSVRPGEGVLNMVTESSEMGEGRGCLVAYTLPCFPNFSHPPPFTLQLWRDVWHTFEVDLGSALLWGHLFSFLILFPDPTSKLTSKVFRTAKWDELGWGDQVSIAFVKGILCWKRLILFLNRASHVSQARFEFTIIMYIMLIIFFCAVLAQWKAACGRSCPHLHFRPRHVPVNYPSKTLSWVRLAPQLCKGERKMKKKNSKQLKINTVTDLWRAGRWRL